MIDELQLGTLINKCKHMKYKFADVYAADNFPFNLKNDNFITVNSDKSSQMRTHWLLLRNRNNEYLFADPLGLPLNNYSQVRDRLSLADLGVTDIIQAPLQNFDSNLCGLYCIYLALYIFGAHFPIIPYVSEQELMRFVKHFV